MNLPLHKSIVAVGSAGLLALTLAGCGASEKSGAGSAKAGAGALECRDGRILVGVAKAESGFASFFDIAGRRGLEVAVDEINDSGGVKGCRLELQARDTKSDPAVGAQVAKALVDAGAQILVVADDFDTGVAAAKVGQSAGVLTLSLAASSTVFGKAVGDLFFSGGITTTELGRAQARYALDQDWKSTFQVIDTGLAYFTEQDEQFRALYEPTGGKIGKVEKVDSLGGQADFSAVISSIKAAKPDVVQALAVYPAVGTFVKQLRAAGVDTPVVGNITLQTKELPGLVGKSAADRIYYAAQIYFEGTGTDPAIDKFVQAYQAKFGQFPEQANAPGAYQTFMAINQALQQDKVVDARTAADTIRGQTALPVPGGTLSQWKDGYAIWDPAVIGLEAGAWSVKKTYQAKNLLGE
ncbi:amino acid/amide ABC transporter substrate-binding protein (HAAT family) [Kribbella amoyensis]|uniref:Amino acid/amide ABC transporter substrate-binding protein (HAAT family) n=1 Tax=Kribbella amoyensis TaxID=996641 RepID=A0A561B816_9ACTN|nr:ABC transporter substrate-binding protein [Kribbella amoyensis]TWD75094.1 amino acid/amide ABC transporter substrate-binding protein (HAAT family) [Kribbella amoyensis]